MESVLPRHGITPLRLRNRRLPRSPSTISDNPTTVKGTALIPVFGIDDAPVRVTVGSAPATLEDPPVDAELELARVLGCVPEVLLVFEVLA